MLKASLTVLSGIRFSLETDPLIDQIYDLRERALLEALELLRGVLEDIDISVENTRLSDTQRKYFCKRLERVRYGIQELNDKMERIDKRVTQKDDCTII
jgi:hypothetical protein